MQALHKYEMLRKKAEEKLNKKTIDLELPKDIEELIHELHIYQMELEIQNEELMRSKEELEKLHRKYYDLYNTAPVGYFSLDRKGVILETNCVGAEFLKTKKEYLINTPFGSFLTLKSYKSFTNAFKMAIKSNIRQGCDLELIKKNGLIFNVHAEILFIKEDDQFRVALIDITERKVLESQLKGHMKYIEETVEKSIAELTFTGDNIHEVIDEKIIFKRDT